MEQVKKIKVAMVCNMSNPMVRSHLPLDDGRYYNQIRKLLRMKPKKEGSNDIAMWNTFFAGEFGKRDDIELTIISVHSSLKKLKVSFKESNVNYVFLNHQWANLIKRIVNNRERWVKLNPFSKIVKREIKRVDPDLVLLMGLENSYYSGTVLGLTEYPVYALCQTVYNNPDRKLYGAVNQDNAYTEMLLFNELRYIGVFCKMHYDLVRQLSPQSYILKFGGFPTRAELLKPVEICKEYDFVNFAMSMSLGKGYQDSIKALAIVKNKYPEVKLNLVGMCSAETKSELLKLIETLGLKENVFLTPFFDNQNDLFTHIQKSRFAVLPCKMDNVSGTMTQAMQLNLPIVVYKTAGTPSLNNNKTCALIAEKDNYEQLAHHMISLMDDSRLAETLRKNARDEQEKKYERDMCIAGDLLLNFRAIVDNFRNGTLIPQGQLFNPESDRKK